MLILEILLRLVAKNLTAMLIDVDLHFFGHLVGLPEEEVIQQKEKVFHATVSTGNIKCRAPLHKPSIVWIVLARQHELNPALLH